VACVGCSLDFSSNASASRLDLVVLALLRNDMGYKSCDTLDFHSCYTVNRAS